jgi:acetyl-CoA synthetase
MNMGDKPNFAELSAAAWPTIRKSASALKPAPNLADYDAFRRDFRWEAARAELDGLPGGGLNIAYEAVDRHVTHGHGARLAIRWLGKNGERRDFSYAELSALSDRFARLLARLGIGKGDAVFSLTGRIPDLYVAALGCLKNGSVFSPLFAAFGPEPLQTRMRLGEAKALITTSALYKRKVESWRASLPSLQQVLIIDDARLPNTVSLAAALPKEEPVAEPARTEPDDPALLHFTSGTTGRPKGAIHIHGAVTVHHMTGKYALDLHPGDVFWCTADPGWVTGTSYGIIAPLTNGVTMVVDEAEFDADRWYRILQQEKVTVWYTAPTAIRMLMRAGAELPRRYNLSSLRFAASVGEPLNPEAVVWGAEVLGRPFHDNWWQTETGGIMIANYAAMDVKPGSMGRPLPGVDATILRRTDGGIEEVEAPLTTGELALKAGWPAMFRGYLNEPERYAKCFFGDWYLTGDLAMRDADGYYWFIGRADDVIKSAGHLIGPFEVETALLEHPSVAEAAVIGMPHPTLGEVVKAFVALRSGFTADDSLRKELLGHARKRLGAAVAPKEIDFRPSLPRTRSGKIMRRLLRARELGLPEGDTSALEGDSQ